MQELENAVDNLNETRDMIWLLLPDPKKETNKSKNYFGPLVPETILWKSLQRIKMVTH